MASTIATVLLVAALVGIINCVYGQLIAGDVCKMKDGRAGVCKNLHECQSAKDIVKKQGRPEMCSFTLNKAIVCCHVDNSTQKCYEYASAVYHIEEIQTLLFDSYTISTSTCSQSAQELIVGGLEAISKEFPHMAALGYGDESDKAWLCGGSLISERYVLTAAHCLFSQGRGAVKWVLLGDLDYQSTEDDSQPTLTEVELKIKHPDYNASSHYYDIALLKLKDVIVFNAYVRPACLNTNNNIPVFGGSVVATGYGLTEHTGDLSSRLMKVSLNIDLASKCNDTFKALQSRQLTRGFDEASMICAGDPIGNGKGVFKDTCGGDSGSPLQINLQDPYCMYSIVGLTSFGNAGCGLSLAPAVYTRVSYFVPWIESIVWPSN